MGSIFSAATADESDDFSNRRESVKADYEAHAKMMAQMHGFKRDPTLSSKYGQVIQFTWNTDTKPLPATRISREQHRPIWVSHLSVGATHVGRIISGRVTHGGIFTGGMYFVLEDALGELVKVGVYGVDGASPHTSAELFPVGRFLSISEPYFKQGVDGLRFIRVDNPDEICDKKLLPQDARAWHLEGNDFFAVGDSKAAKAAIKCWEYALEKSCAGSSVLLLCNRAAALLKSDRFAEAARDCGAALVIEPSSRKAASRLVSALAGLGMKEAVLIADYYATLWPELKPHFLKQTGQMAQEARQLSQGSFGLWWEDPRILEALTLNTVPEDASNSSTESWEALKLCGNEHFHSGVSRVRFLGSEAYAQPFL